MAIDNDDWDELKLPQNLTQIRNVRFTCYPLFFSFPFFSPPLSPPYSFLATFCPRFSHSLPTLHHTLQHTFALSIIIIHTTNLFYFFPRLFFFSSTIFPFSFILLLYIAILGITDVIWSLRSFHFFFSSNLLRVSGIVEKSKKKKMVRLAIFLFSFDTALFPGSI